MNAGVGAASLALRLSLWQINTNYILDPKPCLPKLHPAAWSSCPSLRTSSMHGVADQRRLHALRFECGVGALNPTVSPK